MKILSGSSAHPLFSRCPALRETLPHAPLGIFPTPVERLDGLASELEIGQLWVMRDDLSDATYGGNKVRKLEFLLADALRSGAREVVTFGALGSNHALATTVHAARLGLATTLFLMPQPVTDRVRRNLLLDHAFGARMHRAADRDDAVTRAAAYVAAREAETGVAPYVIPFGGTNALSTCGMIDAGLELVMQCFQSECPIPDVLYVALGSMGTAAGIAVGLGIAGRATEVRAVRVTPETTASAARLDDLVEEVCDMMCGLDPSCGCTVQIETHLTVVDDFFGAGYGHPSAPAAEAVALARTAGLTLEETYTGRAFAAIVADARSGQLAGKTVMFWNTYNSRDLTARLEGADPAELPEDFRAFFGDHEAS